MWRKLVDRLGTSCEIFMWLHVVVCLHKKLSGFNFFTQLANDIALFSPPTEWKRITLASLYSGIVPHVQHFSRLHERWITLTTGYSNFQKNFHLSNFLNMFSILSGKNHTEVKVTFYVLCVQYPSYHCFLFLSATVYEKNLKLMDRAIHILCN